MPSSTKLEVSQLLGLVDGGIDSIWSMEIDIRVRKYEGRVDTNGG